MMVVTNTIPSYPVVQDVASVMKFEKFYSLAKLMGVLTFVFRFVLAMKKPLDDPDLSARVYLLKLVQSNPLKTENFPVKSCQSRAPPPLVANLDVFLDDRVSQI